MKNYWHIHRGILCELSDNIEERIEYIKNNKPAGEIELRLRLLREVKGKLPEACETAREAYNTTQEAYNVALEACKTALEACKTAWRAYNVALGAYNVALETCKEEIEVLHKKECPDCPWDGHTIFNR